MIETLTKHLPQTIIHLPRSSKIKRSIYTDGERFYINYRLSYITHNFNGKEFSEVHKVNGVWFKK